MRLIAVTSFCRESCPVQSVGMSVVLTCLEGGLIKCVGNEHVMCFNITRVNTHHYQNMHRAVVAPPSARRCLTVSTRRPPPASLLYHSVPVFTRRPPPSPQRRQLCRLPCAQPVPPAARASLPIVVSFTPTRRRCSRRGRSRRARTGRPCDRRSGACGPSSAPSGTRGRSTAPWRYPSRTCSPSRPGCRAFQFHLERVI